MPVAVGCVEARDVQPLPATAMRPDGDVAALAAGAAADIRALRQHANTQRVLLENCIVKGK